MQASRLREVSSHLAQHRAAALSGRPEHKGSCARTEAVVTPHALEKKSGPTKTPNKVLGAPADLYLPHVAPKLLRTSRIPMRPQRAPTTN
eukprot:9411370-Pyramimonas_sp.AAC.1